MGSAGGCSVTLESATRMWAMSGYSAAFTTSSTGAITPYASAPCSITCRDASRYVVNVGPLMRSYQFAWWPIDGATYHTYAPYLYLYFYHYRYRYHYHNRPSSHCSRSISASFFLFFFFLNWNFVEGFIAVVGKYFRARCLKCITAFWGAWNPSRSAANVAFQQLPANQLFILNFIYYLNFVEGSVFVNRR